MTPDQLQNMSAEDTERYLGQPTTIIVNRGEIMAILPLLLVRLKDSASDPEFLSKVMRYPYTLKRYVDMFIMAQKMHRAGVSLGMIAEDEVVDATLTNNIQNLQNAFNDMVNGAEIIIDHTIYSTDFHPLTKEDAANILASAMEEFGPGEAE